VNHLVIETAKRAGVDRLKMVLVTDIHMGSIIGKAKVEKMVEMVNAQQPDLVLLGGDMVDDDLRPVKRKDLGKYFFRITAPLGVYAVSGNHEHIGGADASLNYLAAYGVKVLRDTAVKLPQGVWIVGLEDKDMQRFAGKSRKPLAEVMKEVDLSQPILLLDHQPVMLPEKAAAGVDLSFSGHTHDGQLWPLGHLAKAIYGISKGYLRVGEMQLYVSPGFGSWGPPVRIGHRPEILVVDWVFQKD
jgi:predicted MPP superfamily phosphohydrolase